MLCFALCCLWCRVLFYFGVVLCFVSQERISVVFACVSCVLVLCCVVLCCVVSFEYCIVPVLVLVSHSSNVVLCCLVLLFGVSFVMFSFALSFFPGVVCVNLVLSCLMLPLPCLVLPCCAHPFSSSRNSKTWVCVSHLAFRRPSACLVQTGTEPIKMGDVADILGLSEAQKDRVSPCLEL